jgi:hypothetical protein
MPEIIKFAFDKGFSFDIDKVSNFVGPEELPSLIKDIMK